MRVRIQGKHGVMLKAGMTNREEMGLQVAGAPSGQFKNHPGTVAWLQKSAGEEGGEEISGHSNGQERQRWTQRYTGIGKVALCTDGLLLARQVGSSYLDRLISRER